MPTLVTLHAAKRWCFTLNNYTETELSDFLHWSENCSYVVVGEEFGENGTPHLQGFFILKRRRRLTQVKLIPGLARAHLEVARGTNAQASDYCKKDGSYREFGTLKTAQGSRSDFEQLRDWIKELDYRPSDFDVAEVFPGLLGRYPRAVRKFCDLYSPPVEYVDINSPLRGWQRALELRLTEQPDDRQVMFVVDVNGNVGKSWFTRYMLTKYADKVQRLSIGRREDLAFAIDPTKSIFLFDIPRGQVEFMQYVVFEQLKDGIVFSTKYESGNKFVGPCHVVVFMNEKPDLNQLSADRYDITNLHSL